MSDAAPDVLVVGAGPTGLCLAAELHRHGLAVRIVEKEPAPSPLSKALAVHARSLELLERLGVTEELLRRGIEVTSVTVHARGRPIVHFRLDELHSRYGYILGLPQSDTEAVLADELARRGMTVERGTALDALERGPGGVSATLVGPDGGREELRVPWLVGCDGAHSTVREALGEPFEGHRASEVFALADVRVDGEDFHGDALTSFFSEEGTVGLIPMPGVRRARLVATLADDAAAVTVAGGAELGGDGRVPPPTLEELQRLLAERAPEADLRIDDPSWLSTFRVSYRLVPHYRVGRVFLAGDAAHIHSPAGGQGMNTGLQDAFNLAWKLAAVHGGVGRSELLDSYEHERRAIAEGVLESTERATQVATLRNPIGRKLRDEVARFLTSLEIVQERISAGAAGLAISYATSPVVAQHQSSLLRARIGSERTAESANVTGWRAFNAAPAAGTRAPDGTVGQRGRDRSVRLFELFAASTGHALLLFDGEAPTPDGYRNLAEIGRRVRERVGELVDVHIVVPRDDVPAELAGWDGSLLFDPEGDAELAYGARAECLYLVRPDGYIGFRSQPADGDRLLAYLERVFI